MPIHGDLIISRLKFHEVNIYNSQLRYPYLPKKSPVVLHFRVTTGLFCVCLFQSVTLLYARSGFAASSLFIERRLRQVAVRLSSVCKTLFRSGRYRTNRINSPCAVVSTQDIRGFSLLSHPTPRADICRPPIVP